MEHIQALRHGDFVSVIIRPESSGFFTIKPYLSHILKGKSDCFTPPDNGALFTSGTLLVSYLKDLESGNPGDISFDRNIDCRLQIRNVEILPLFSKNGKQDNESLKSDFNYVYLTFRILNLLYLDLNESLSTIPSPGRFSRLFVTQRILIEDVLEILRSAVSAGSRNGVRRFNYETLYSDLESSLTETFSFSMPSGKIMSLIKKIRDRNEELNQLITKITGTKPGRHS